MDGIQPLYASLSALPRHPLYHRVVLTLTPSPRARAGLVFLCTGAQGVKQEHNCSLAPVTTRLLESIPSFMSGRYGPQFHNPAFFLFYYSRMILKLRTWCAQRPLLRVF